jgi:hypothetical protein
MAEKKGEGGPIIRSNVKLSMFALNPQRVQVQSNAEREKLIS